MHKTNKLSLKSISKLCSNDFLFSILIGVIIIGCGTFLGWYNNKVVLANPDPHAHYQSQSKNPLSFMSDWDGPIYIRIAQQSYTNVGNANFLPLYPILIHVVHLLLHSFLDSALIISWISFVVAIYFFIKITKKLFLLNSNLKVFNYLVYFIFFPTAIFFLATYSEALFAALALGSIYAALLKKPFLAGLLASLVIVTNIDGLLVLLLVLLILLEEKIQYRKIFLALIEGLFGLGAFALYLKDRFNQPLAFILSQKAHGWLNGKYSELVSSFDLFNFLFIILILLAAYYWWNKRKSFSIYALSFLLIPIIGNQFGGFNRYVLMVFPVPWMLYPILKKYPILLTLSIVAFSVAWTYFLLQYSGGYVGG
jgi:Gpi18-like mannosyltransferase